MKKIVLFAALVLVFGCNGDDENPYDPEAQLQIDLGLIDDYVSDKGQAVIIHESGIRYFIEEEGGTQKPQIGDSVATDYEIYTLMES